MSVDDKDDKTPWWKGGRGEWYVVAQVAFMALILFGPHTLHGWPARAFPQGRLVSVAGLALVLGGAGLIIAGGLKLGSALTPLPRPGERAVLQETGVYRFVRHPMYSGALLAAFGWALAGRGWLTLVYAAAACVSIDIKVRREEKWLCERFPEYDAYQRRVRKFIPFVY